MIMILNNYKNEKAYLKTVGIVGPLFCIQVKNLQAKFYLLFITMASVKISNLLFNCQR